MYVFLFNVIDIVLEYFIGTISNQNHINFFI